jgi:hypothetical protein
MNRLPKKHRWYLLPWGVAALMLCIGSLINFHQYRIWHHPLLPQLVAHKKDIEYTQTDLVLAKIQFDKDQTQFQTFTQTGNISENFLTLPAIQFSFVVEGCYTSNRNPSVQSHGLRAPPLS